MLSIEPHSPGKDGDYYVVSIFTNGKSRFISFTIAAAVFKYFEIDFCIDSCSVNTNKSLYNFKKVRHFSGLSLGERVQEY